MSATIIDLTGRYREAGELHVYDPARELSRALERIAELEQDLATAMRDCLGHYRRAEEAERRLAELEAGGRFDE